MMTASLYIQGHLSDSISWPNQWFSQAPAYLKVLLQRYCILISFGLLVRPVVQSVALCSCDRNVSCKVLTYLKLELWHISVTVCYIKHALFTLEAVTNQYSFGNIPGE